MEKSKKYKERIKLHTPNSTVAKDCVFSFLFGGGICALGELLSSLYQSLSINETDSYALVSVTLIAIAAILTGLGIFDKIARYAGAGTLVPVTGFANSVVSAAIDTKSEGYILGVGAKIFTIAGPVILYGILSGTLLGVIYYITMLFI